MKVISFIVSLIFISLSAFAQNAFRFERIISWNAPQTNYATGRTVPNFAEATYPNMENPMPYFSELIPLDAGKSFQVSQITLKAISTEMQNSLEMVDIQSVDSEFNVKAHVLQSRGQSFLKIEISTIRSNTNGYERLKAFELNYSLTEISTTEKGGSDKTENSVLSSGTWLKIAIPASGVYKITYDELISMGISTPANVRIFGNATGLLSFDYDGSYRPDDLTENKLMHADNSIYFYALDAETWKYSDTNKRFNCNEHFYSDNAYYFLTSDYNSGFDNSISELQSSENQAVNAISSYTGFAIHNVNELNLAKSGRILYGETFEFEPTQQFSFTFPSLVDNSVANVEIASAAFSGSVSSMQCSASGTEKTFYMQAASDHDFGRRGSAQFDFSAPENSDNIVVNLSFSGASGAKSWLDYISVNAEQALTYANSQLSFRSKIGFKTNDIHEFQISNADNELILWNLDKTEHPRKCIGTLSSGKFLFKAENSQITEYVAFKTKDAKRIVTSKAKPVPNQNLHATASNTDMIIISHPNFLSYAQEIKELHEEEGLVVTVVSTDQVYNEFSSGMADVSAYRDFARFVYEKGDGYLRYMLFFGDGSYDNKNVINKTVAPDNFILTYESLDSETANSYVTDDFFGFLDETEGASGSGIYGLIDIGIGRIPASTDEEARIAVDKIKMHTNPETYSAWRNQLCFIADDQDKNQFAHMEDADVLTEYITEHYPQFNIEKIYLDAFQQYSVSGGERYPDVNSAIKNRVQTGSLIMNYTGHGGPRGVADERIISTNEIDNWYNPNMLSLWVTATCEFTPFDKFETVPAGERLFFNPSGGAYAMFTTVRLAYIGSNAALTKQFYSRVFQRDTNGEPLRLGDISRLTKNAQLGYNTFVFVLLGDPALKVGFAEQKVETSKINGVDANLFTDTIKAFEKATISGQITDKNGLILTDFNGVVYPTVFDKFRNVTTLNNDGFGTFDFRTRDNVVYKGMAAVTNGKFEFSFIVPRDIQLNTGLAKVNYYAENGIITAAGSYENLMLGGISEQSADDNEGPEIQLFMNDTTFTDGGITDANPKIFAKLWDQNGINTASGGVGHDITAVIDDETQNTYILNSGYLANLDSYQGGTVEYFLSDLPLGAHVLKLKAWDVFNNYSTSDLNFVVADGDNLIIEDLIAFPNPFSDQTSIYFEHNQGTDLLNITLDFFNLTGALVSSMNVEYQSEGYRAGPFVWNGTSQGGTSLQPGLYLYRVTVKNEAGEMRQLGEKLVLVR